MAAFEWADRAADDECTATGVAEANALTAAFVTLLETLAVEFTFLNAVCAFALDVTFFAVEVTFFAAYVAFSIVVAFLVVDAGFFEGTTRLEVFALDALAFVEVVFFATTFRATVTAADNDPLTGTRYHLHVRREC